ncbi:MAG: hypothetical protein IJL70_03340 [Treponema sp.]|nr:hypothetical protein [Treponema sp.]
MDDAEYYNLMRNQNFHHTQISRKSKNSDYKKWETFQGREDADMLVEKKIDDTQDENSEN